MQEPNLEEIRARFSSGRETTEPSQAGLEFLEQEKIRVTAEREDKKIANDLARPATKEAIEKEGYLYHFAPNKYSESIAEKGIVSNKDPRAAQGAGKIFYWTDPSRATPGAFVPDVADGGTLDLYRTKVTPEMLDSFQMDPMVSNKDGVARAVFFEADSFPAEKIGTRGVFDESTGGIKYDPVVSNTTVSGQQPPPTRASNTAMGGKEFIDLINSQDTTEGRDTTIGQSILDIASGKTAIREGLSGHDGSKSRDIAETLARGRGFLGPVQQTADQEIDRMMSEGTGLEVLRGADRTSLENLTTDKSSQTPISAYDEGGTGLYFTVEAASDKMIKEKGIEYSEGKAQYSADYYARNAGEKANPTGAVMRAVLPSDAKIGSKRDPKYLEDVGTRLDVIAKDLDDIEKAGQDVSHARHVLSALRENTRENSAADILSGYDAVAHQDNEVRLINRTAALSSGVKSPEKMKQLYPETPRKGIRGQRDNEKI